jgi:hypothetical protein
VPVAPAESAPVSARADSSSTPAAPPGRTPLAVPSRHAAQRRGVLTVRLHCRSRSRSCAGTLRALGRAKRFTISPGSAATVRFAARAPRAKLRVLVAAGERRRVWRVSVGR